MRAAVERDVVDGAVEPVPVITALTGVRALAASWVVLFHVHFVLEALFPAVSVLDPWLLDGQLGVDVFFVLSGFVISHNYAASLARPSPRAGGQFLVARLARIYPVHVTTLLVTAALVAFFARRGLDLYPAGAHTVGGFVGNLMMLQALPGVPAWNAASWSVSCEMAAYLGFPLVAGLLMRLGRSGALLGAATVVAAQLLAIEAFPALYPFDWVRLVAEFTLGCLLWAAWRHGTARHWRWDLIGAGCLVAVAVVADVGNTWSAVPFLALFVVATASATGPLRAVLSSRPMQWGGRVSYSLYLVHVPVIVVLVALLPPGRFAAASTATRVVVTAAYLGGVLVAAAAMYHLVEEPARRWIRSRVTIRNVPAVRVVGRDG